MVQCLQATDALKRFQKEIAWKEEWSLLPHKVMAVQVLKNFQQQFIRKNMYHICVAKDESCTFSKECTQQKKRQRGLKLKTLVCCLKLKIFKNKTINFFPFLIYQNQDTLSFSFSFSNVKLIPLLLWRSDNDDLCLSFKVNWYFLFGRSDGN